MYRMLFGRFPFEVRIDLILGISGGRLAAEILISPMDFTFIGA